MPSDPSSPPARDNLLAFADSILARAATAPVTPEAEVCPSVTFFLAEKELGIPIMRSREILRVGTITRIPEAPPHVRGVLNLRGRVVPVVELRARLGLPEVPVTAHSRVIIVEAHGRLFGLLVDRASRIAKVPMSALRPASDQDWPANLDAVAGVVPVGAESIILLDVDRLVLPDAPEG